MSRATDRLDGFGTVLSRQADCGRGAAGRRAFVFDRTCFLSPQLRPVWGDAKRILARRKMENHGGPWSSSTAGGARGGDRAIMRIRWSSSISSSIDVATYSALAGYGVGGAAAQDFARRARRKEKPRRIAKYFILNIRFFILGTLDLVLGWPGLISSRPGFNSGFADFILGNPGQPIRQFFAALRGFNLLRALRVKFFVQSRLMRSKWGRMPTPTCPAAFPQQCAHV